jgi:phage terminase large subunit GpA-like protein
MAKMELYARLRLSPTQDETSGQLLYPAGYVHLPKVDAEYLQQLCAEQLITRRDRHGFAHREWQKMRERNEALDCYVYARAAAAIVGLDRFEERHWLELERSLGVAMPPDQPPATPSMNLQQATETGGLVLSGAGKTPSNPRRVIRSPWLR